MSSFMLKVIAFITMIIDHIDKSISPFSYLPYANILEMIGRIAFPIFAFLAAEGIHKTKNIKRYILRLFLFALISEIFFDFALSVYNVAHNFSGNVVFYDPGHQNVIFTILLAVISIYCYESLKNRGFMILGAIPVMIAIMVADRFKTDYGAFGVILIVALYLCKTRKQQVICMLTLLTLFYMGAASWDGSTFAWLDVRTFSYYLSKWIFACFSAIPIVFYNGEKGIGSKWLFYIGYPLHLLVLGFIRELFFATG